MSITRRTPGNRFKERLAAAEQLIGLWMVLGDGYSAELLAGCGYDWLLIDAEHGPNDLRSVLAQLQGIAAAATLLGEHADEVSHPVVRLPGQSPVLIKQYLEIGARNLLIPMVDTPEQAEELVRAARYAPRGMRGMGSGLARSSRWGRLTDYVEAADEDVCLIVQAETRQAIENLSQIAAVDGVDAVLFGPADLAADMGLKMQRTHPDVVAAIQRGVRDVSAAGKPAGIMLTDAAAARRWLAEGITFAGVGVDTALLIRAADDLLESFHGTDLPSAAPITQY